MQINLKLYGAFKVMGEHIALSLPPTAKIKDLTPALRAHIKQMGGPDSLLKLIPVSRFATESEILTNDAELFSGIDLVILPPVSGG